MTRVPALRRRSIRRSRCELAERAPHGDARNAVLRRQIILGGQPCAEAEGAAHDAVAQHQVDLLRLGLAEPVAPQRLPPAAGGEMAGALLGII